MNNKFQILKEFQEYHDHAAQYIEPGDVTTSQPGQEKNGPQEEWLTKDVWQLGIWSILAVILVGSAYVSYHQRYEHFKHTRNF